MSVNGQNDAFRDAFGISKKDTVNVFPNQPPEQQILNTKEMFPKNLPKQKISSNENRPMVKFVMQEQLEKQIKTLKEKIKNFNPMDEAQKEEKTRLESLLNVYEAQMEYLRATEMLSDPPKDMKPFFGEV